MERSSNLLDEALGIFHNNSSSSSSSLPSGSCVLIEDCIETSGAFVINHILKRSLSASASVIFVSLSHPFSHYDRILRKHGCNLAAHRESGRFFFFDMLMLGCTDQSMGNIQSGGLIEFYGKIQKVVEDIISSNGNSKSITIMLDDFSLIEVAAKGSFNHSLDFLRYCYTLTSEFGCSLVILNHEDIYLGEESSTPIVQMEYLANILIKVEPLATGLATDVHGQLTILNKGMLDESRSSTNKVQNFHFKLKENGIDCFYPGTRA
ncbi:elongator complex protein 6-like [Chenopodium quinoa]|uniref:elongator complex protein 6-like n=1 Tax=Chenopodium quinoa TaxID=63459 RepID=UPI000B799FF1|nr:elongator complex protein 6-like [Chenopodium quinoa]